MMIPIVQAVLEQMDSTEYDVTRMEQADAQTNTVIEMEEKNESDPTSVSGKGLLADAAELAALRASWPIQGKGAVSWRKIPKRTTFRLPVPVAARLWCWVLYPVRIVMPFPSSWGCPHILSSAELPAQGIEKHILWEIPSNLPASHFLWFLVGIHISNM